MKIHSTAQMYVKSVTMPSRAAPFMLHAVKAVLHALHLLLCVWIEDAFYSDDKLSAGLHIAALFLSWLISWCEWLVKSG